MGKRILAVAIAAVATIGVTMPAARAVEAECTKLCVMCDPTQTNCDGCIEYWVLEQRYEFC
ncbi:MAG TPA: hypothetical protein VNQ77_07875 [Frankiaceae bacterium]|nr:hypothetical protein [Frankiaceae bacterium]